MKTGKILYIIGAIFIVHNVCGQSLFGTDNYIEYNIGQLPILISVPHGGNIAPAFIPDRKCNDPTTVTDANTIDLGIKIDSIFKAKTGCRPHIIYCRLRRTKLDTNRNITDGTCGNPVAITSWQEFHHFIDTARLQIQQKFGNKAFYFDLHGHGNPIQRIELGYLLRSGELEFDDDILNQTTFIEKSSIQNLAKNNILKLSHAQLLRGPLALGSMLEKRFYPSVPSQSDPRPGMNSGYFSGGYNTVTHTCYNPNLEINGVQVECNFSNVRDNEKNRIAFAEAFVESVLEYMQIHFNIALKDCLSLTSITPSEQSDDLYVYPSIVRPYDNIKIYNSSESVHTTWYDINGMQLNKSIIYGDQLNVPDLISGIYFLKIKSGEKQHTKKIIVIE